MRFEVSLMYLILLSSTDFLLQNALPDLNNTGNGNTVSMLVVGQEPSGLYIPQRSVAAVLRYKFLMTTVRSYTTIFQDNNPVHFHNGGKAVCYNDDRLSLHESLECILNKRF